MSITQKIGQAAKASLSVIKWLPMLFGSLYVFRVKAPTGRSLVDDVKAMNIDDFLYDGKEIFTGVDVYGRFQSYWFKQTYLPVFVGTAVSGFLGWLQDKL